MVLLFCCGSPGYRHSLQVLNVALRELTERGVKRTISGVITAFTLAHSIALALASLKLIHVPSPPAETVIVLSIVILAVEIAKMR
ncbi:HupE/UreJ family protein [Ruegeria conchae]|uniref:HupE/UreJ family protein n=1 Tax=Ruegeria conchae TaxID=981384 RepID=UPI0039843889